MFFMMLMFSQTFGQSMLQTSSDVWKEVGQGTHQLGYKFSFTKDTSEDNCIGENILVTSS